MRFLPHILVCFPYSWKAGCGESRPSGLGRAGQKPTRESEQGADLLLHNTFSKSSTISFQKKKSVWHKNIVWFDCVVSNMQQVQDSIPRAPGRRSPLQLPPHGLSGDRRRSEKGAGGALHSLQRGPCAQHPPLRLRVSTLDSGCGRLGRDLCQELPQLAVEPRRVLQLVEMADVFDHPQLRIGNVIG